jgi:hypothetical protein
VCLSIQPAFVAGKKIGFPYGAIPRLLFFWMTEQVQLTKSRRDLSIEEKRTLVLGTSLNDFMRQLGLNPATGGGKRGDAKRWRNQAIRLFRSHIALDEISKAPDWKTMEVAEAGRLWGDPKHADQESLFPSWVLLTEKMYRYLVEVPVPIDMRALKALKGSSLALDLYAYICHRAFVMFKRNEGLEGEGRKHDFIAWRYLLKQFGTGYQGVRAAHDFQKEAKRWMMKIEKLYPGLEIRYDKHKGGGGFWIDATRLAVPERNVFFTGNDIVAGGGIVACMAVKHGSTLILSDNDKLALTEPRPETPETSKEG